MSDRGSMSDLYLESLPKHWWYTVTPTTTVTHHGFNLRLVRAAALGLFQVYSSFTTRGIEVSDLEQIFNLTSSPGISLEITHLQLGRTVAT